MSRREAHAVSRSGTTQRTTSVPTAPARSHGSSPRQHASGHTEAGAAATSVPPLTPAAAISGRTTEYRKYKKLSGDQNTIAQVWLALDKRGRLFVTKETLKRLPIPSSETPEQAKLREADDSHRRAIYENERNIMILLRNERKYVIRVRDFGETPTHYFLWMDFAETGSLRFVLSHGSIVRPDPQIIRHLIKGLLQAMKLVHSRGVIHRDIKAANVLVTKSLHVLLADFGLAIMAEDKTSDWRRRLVGTRGWMAPEVLTSYEYGVPSDVWAFGCTVLEIVTGADPFFEHFPDPTLRHAMYKNEESVQRWLPVQLRQVSPHLEDFVMGCFAKDPQSRMTIQALLKHPYIASAGTTSASPGVATDAQSVGGASASSGGGDDVARRNSGGPFMDITFLQRAVLTNHRRTARRERAAEGHDDDSAASLGGSSDDLAPTEEGEVDQEGLHSFYHPRADAPPPSSPQVPPPDAPMAFELAPGVLQSVLAPVGGDGQSADDATGGAVTPRPRAPRRRSQRDRDLVCWQRVILGVLLLVVVTLGIVAGVEGGATR